MDVRAPRTSPIKLTGGRAAAAQLAAPSRASAREQTSSFPLSLLGSGTGKKKCSKAGKTAVMAGSSTSATSPPRGCPTWATDSSSPSSDRRSPTSPRMSASASTRSTCSGALASSGSSSAPSPQDSPSRGPHCHFHQLPARTPTCYSPSP